jgi:thiazole synthase ThiGH ThiG subunit
VLLLSRESLSMASVGGTGERTSVIVDVGWIVWGVEKRACSAAELGSDGVLLVLCVGRWR